jgi:putative effector of murein hydrolase LrgA (UPF0299 family)
MRKIKITVCLVLSFFISFLATTVLTDWLARETGFYSVGEEESRSVGE